MFEVQLLYIVKNKLKLSLLERCCCTVSGLLTLHSGTETVFSDVLNWHRHEVNTQSKNNIFAFVGLV